MAAVSLTRAVGIASGIGDDRTELRCRLLRLEALKLMGCKFRLRSCAAFALEEIPRVAELAQQHASELLGSVQQQRHATLARHQQEGGGVVVAVRDATSQGFNQGNGTSTSVIDVVSTVSRATSDPGGRLAEMQRMKTPCVVVWLCGGV